MLTSCAGAQRGAAVGEVGAEDQPQQFSAPGADQPGNPEISPARTSKDTSRTLSERVSP
jgi:hypothetical protein